jgi:competence protein ComEA
MIRTLFSVLALVAVVMAHPLAQTPAPDKANSRAAKPPVMVNINTASATELEELPGVGAKTAARIIEYRQKKGPFKKIEELMNVQGIGEKSFLKLRAQLTVSAKPEPANQQ